MKALFIGGTVRLVRQSLPSFWQQGMIYGCLTGERAMMCCRPELILFRLISETRKMWLVNCPDRLLMWWRILLRLHRSSWRETIGYLEERLSNLSISVQHPLIRNRCQTTESMREHHSRIPIGSIHATRLRERNC